MFLHSLPAHLVKSPMPSMEHRSSLKLSRGIGNMSPYLLPFFHCPVFPRFSIENPPRYCNPKFNLENSGTCHPNLRSLQCVSIFMCLKFGVQTSPSPKKRYQELVAS